MTHYTRIFNWNERARQKEYDAAQNDKKSGHGASAEHTLVDVVAEAVVGEVSRAPGQLAEPRFGPPSEALAPHQSGQTRAEPSGKTRPTRGCQGGL